jgi:hypothetical protein
VALRPEPVVVLGIGGEAAGDHVDGVRVGVPRGDRPGPDEGAEQLVRRDLPVDGDIGVGHATLPVGVEW